VKVDLSFAEKYTKITTLDMHTGGEPLRIVLEGYPSFKQKPIFYVGTPRTCRYVRFTNGRA